jgi:signal transduction histidine kinase/HAMP domain-containing protein/ActR/RegA family two-component response regulator
MLLAGPRRGLRTRMTMMLMAGVLFVGVGFEILLTTLTWNREYRELESRAGSLARLMAERSVTSVVVNDRAELRRQVQRALIEPDMQAVAIYPARGPALAQATLDHTLWAELGTPGGDAASGAVVVVRRRAGGGEVLDAIAPIRRGQDQRGTMGEALQVFGFSSAPHAPATGQLGWVRLVVSTAQARRDVQTAAQTGLLLLLLTAVLGYFAVSLFVRVIIRPLREAGGLAREIASGRLERRLPVRSADELGDLAGSMNTMAAALQEARLETEAEAEALRRISTAMLSIARGARVAHDPASIFGIVAHEVKRVTRARAVSLAIPSQNPEVPEFGHFEPPAPWAGLRQGTPAPEHLLGMLTGPTEAALRFAPDPGADCPICRGMIAEGLRTGLAVRLQLPDMPSAVLFAVSDDPEAFPAHEMDVVVALASHLSSALHAEHLRVRLESTFEELERTHDHLVHSEMLRVTGEMAAGVAHDFNNVLGAIMGRAQLLTHKLETGSLSAAELASALAVIERAAEDGRETGRRLRQFGHASQATAMEPADLHVMLQDAIEFTRPRWEDGAHVAGINIEMHLDSQPAAWVAGRANELREIFTNLILNAVDALPLGGSIHATVRKDGKQVIATVADDGIGMDEEAARRLFEPFFTTKGDGGTGLGMSVVYGIVQRHGGKIEVTTQPGAGTRLELRFPLADAPQVLAPDEAAPGTLPALDIMIVDDEASVRDVLRDIALALGQRVTAFASGSEALHGLLPGAFQLVITDLGMPGMTGWELAGRVRALDPAVTISFVTGWGEDVDRRAAGEAGADLVLAKPFSIADVSRAIRLAADRIEKQKAA